MRQVVSVISGLSFCLAFLLPTPTVANPDAASPTAGDEQNLGETIRATVGDPLKSIVDNARDIEALRTFYSARNNAPVFVRPDGPTEKMRAAISRLKAQTKMA